MSIFLQDPATATPHLLLDELEKHFSSADSIYSAFAFVTAKGVDLLFGQEEVAKNLKRADVELVVGMDAITDEKAIEKLISYCAEYKKFSVRAFLPSSGRIFHPKVSLVKTGETGVIVAGSGNLTDGGLKSNFEAFAVVHANKKQTQSMIEKWKQFTEANEEDLFSLDAEEVLEAARQNTRLKSETKKLRKKVGKRVGGDVVPKIASTVFIEDLTRGRGAKQRDVGKWAGKHYFGLETKLFLTHIDDQGERGSVETRKISGKESSNWALDLNASRGLEPVDDDMPIAVFIRTGAHDFLYHIIRPDEADYPAVSKYLSDNGGELSRGKARRIPNEKQTTAILAEELKKAWPTAPFWDLDDEE